jgi:type IX secretion system PorP/SprF family membrane protein
MCILESGVAQDLHFSQFFEAPMLRNPGLAGIFNGDYRIQGVYRDQWNSVTNGYRTGNFNGEYKMSVGSGNDFFTTGLEILYDQAGTVGLTTTEIMPVLNYHKSLSDRRSTYLSLGFMGGYVQKMIDRSKVTTNNQFDGSVFNPAIPDGETFPTPNIHYFDGSVGMTFLTTFGEDELNSFYLGAAYHHLNRPKNSFYQDASQLDPKYVFSGGLRLNVNDYASFTFQADYSLQGPAREAIGGALYSYKLDEEIDDPKYTLNVGAFVRFGDALIPVLKLNVYTLSFAISYDVNISQLKTVSEGQGGVELSISYVGFLKHITTSRGKALSPRF